MGLLDQAFENGPMLGTESRGGILDDVAVEDQLGLGLQAVEPGQKLLPAEKFRAEVQITDYE